ncbi:hypothetical protein A9Q89_05420 [Gammaproteobacteria bacterium 53_120_T64]|nr:hypothetical protein A9Q89_05420 [Gammaproteobacteria bacterium 53_120_T64]
MSDSGTSDIDFFAIDVEQCSWASAKQALTDIRRRVFIDEQGVPEAEEFSPQDQTASHWLAYGADGSPMGCARLLADKVGRMAVLKTHRQQGVGSALLRHVIGFAAKTGLEKIQLDAQVHALPFYEAMNFTRDGSVFDDVGIPHQHMTLSLRQFSNPRVAPSPVDISDEERCHITLDDVGGFRVQADLLVRRAKFKIRIFSPCLDPKIYDNAALHYHLFNFASLHPYAQIHILVKQSQLLVQKSHRLLNLYHRLPSRIQIRTLKPQCLTSHNEFLLTDTAGILYKQALNRYTGYAVYWSPLVATELADEFDELWHACEPDPELRNLVL